MQKSQNNLLDSIKNHELLRAKLSIIEEELFKTFPASAEAKILYEASFHPIRSGGKRLRPLLTLIACEAVRGKIQKALPVATAVELIHTASVIHDDLIDEDEERRNAPTVHVKYDKNTAVLSGDLMISKAMKILSENSPLKVRKIVSEACIEMCEGEYMDIIFKKHPVDATEENYLKMARKKTGALLRAAAACGAIMGEGTDKQIRSLSLYGESVGLSLQLRDDVNEVLAAHQYPAFLNRNCFVGEGSNLVLIHSINNSHGSSQDLLRSLVNSDGNYDRTEEIMDLFENSMSIQHVQSLSEKFENDARAAIRNMSFSNQKVLEDLAKFVSRY